MKEQNAGEKERPILRAFAFLFVAPLIFFANGCATPTGGLSHTRVLQPDQEDNIGGSFIESSDIRTIASQMTPALLSLPEIAHRGDTARIAIAPMRNSTRYIIDQQILMNRLRVELNRVSAGRVRFFSQGADRGIRDEILLERQEDQWSRLLVQSAAALLSSPVVTASDRPLRVAVIPVKNTNLVDVNADSFSSLLRSKIAEQAGGRIVFLSREANGKVIEQILDETDLKDQGLVSRGGARQLLGVDYFLTGEFIAKSTLTHGLDRRVEARAGRSPDDPGVYQSSVSGTQSSPNVTKYLNIKFVDAETAAVSFERLLELETRITSGIGRADFILAGELSALSKAAEGGHRSDYILISFQLIDPITNEMVWEDAYETKRTSNVSVIYR